MKISKQRWQEAQLSERTHHTLSFKQGLDHYFHSYSNYFKYLDIDFDLQLKSVMEIGPADFPALGYCRNYSTSYIIEPMPSPHLLRFLNEHLILIPSPFEELDFDNKVDEIWLLNVMQHVIDPELFVQKCKRTAEVIRFFEPVDEPETVYHPHSFTFGDFEKWFGDSINPYFDKIEGFHQANCVYGCFKTNP